MTTVHPANTTARPEVSIARTTARSRIEPVVQALPVAGDDEQRVVDADADADHRRELRARSRDVVTVWLSELDERDADADAEERDEDRQAHREQRAERDEQDHDGGEDADELGGTDPGTLLEHAPAQRDLRALDLLARLRRSACGSRRASGSGYRRRAGRTARLRRQQCRHSTPAASPQSSTG